MPLTGAEHRELAELEARNIGIMQFGKLSTSELEELTSLESRAPLKGSQQAEESQSLQFGPLTEQQEIAQAQKLNLSKLFGSGRGAVREKQPGETSISPENQEMLRGAMPVVGATAASLLVPPLAATAIPGAIARSTPFIAKFLSNIATKAPAAGLAGGAGGAIRESGQEGATPRSIVQAGAQSAKDMALAEVGGQGVVTAGSKIFPPIAKQLTPHIKKALAFAKKHDIPISPVDFVKTRTAQFLDFFTEKFIPSRFIKDKVSRKRAIIGVNNFISELPQTVGRVKGDISTSTAVSNALKEQVQITFGELSKQITSGASSVKLHPLIRQIVSGKLTPEQFTKNIFVPGNEVLIKTLKSELPKETFNDLAAQNLSNILKEFSRQSTNMPMGIRVLDGNSMLKFLGENKNIIKQTYGKETTEAIFNLARVAKFASRDISKFEKGISRTTLGFNAALAGAGFTVFPTSINLSFSVIPLIGKSLMNPKGILKTALTTGFSGVPRATVRESLKLGGRVVFDDPNEP